MPGSHEAVQVVLNDRWTRFFQQGGRICRRQNAYTQGCEVLEAIDISWYILTSRTYIEKTSRSSSNIISAPNMALSFLRRMATVVVVPNLLKKSARLLHPNW